MARRPLEREGIHLDGGRRTTQLMRNSLGVTVWGDPTITPLLRVALLATVSVLPLPTIGQAQAVDSTGPGLMPLCDTTADSTSGWTEEHGGSARLRFTMRLPPNLDQAFSISTGPTATGEFRQDHRSITWFVFSDSRGALSMSGIEFRHRCYLSIGPHIVQYGSSHRAGIYFAWALWTWPAANRGRTLVMYASGPDSLWQSQALAAFHSVRVDTLDLIPPVEPKR